MIRLFAAPIFVSVIVFALVGWWGGVEAFVLTLALAMLEISLSFDNAVVNAKVLGQMEPRWQRAFLTWGMPIAVFGVRFVLPILIVAAAALASPWRIAVLAFTDPLEYSILLYNATPAIHAFGGAFLLMVALKYFFDEEKRVHWLGSFERSLTRLGKFGAVETLLALGVVLGVGLASVAVSTVLLAGLAGVLLYLLLEFCTKSLMRSLRGGAGLALFVYLNVLDAAFSLDGVVGAFALTTQIFIILAGLGIGAYFVRSFTVYLTRKRTIETFIYLEHGAHWAISVLRCFCLPRSLPTYPK
ncbi:MAG TPA: DUF475 domain-containing protein [Candidatus Paceibacterota bacterium]|nr:DUF475 domain-containing protein [Candidatus Paceibacterota bacterium]